MVRKLSLALALAMGVAPFGVNALGLGDIHLKSALNDYFNADINLLSVATGEISDVRVELASPDAFQRAGVDRSFVLTKLRFKPVALPDGTTVVQVSSRDPIREPFLNFLIEVNWPKGKMVREYTVLLDPPVTLDRRPAPVQSAQASMQTSATSSKATGKSVVQPSDVSWAGSGDAASEYGPTKRNDTLWGIAKKVRHQGATMEQAMMSLFQANPQAFIKQNINNLKIGQILRVPDSDEMMLQGAKDASLAYREQVHAWQADRKPATTSIPEPVESETTSQTAVAQAEPENDAPTAELKIASARPEGEGEAGTGEDDGSAVQVADRLEQDLITAQEATDSAVQEGEELRTRVGDLEAQLDDLQRLLTLKDDQLARLQVAVAEGTEEQGEGEEVILEIEEEQAAVEETVITEEPVTTEEQAPISQAVTEPEAKPVLAVEPPKQQIQPTLVDKAKSFIERLSGDATMLGISLASVVVLLALLWVAISRRRSNTADFQESILVSSLEDSEAEPMEGVPTGTTTQIAEETSFLSDFSPSDIDALQDETGEVDPIAEADVYIAYGRYQQAEELIRQAIERNPDRDELKHKLFEILFATKDSDSFVALAEQSAADGFDKSDADVWLKVVAMGTQLAAGHALFSGTDAAAPASDGQVDAELSSLEDDLGLSDDLDLDLDDLSSDLDLDLSGETTAEDDLGSFSLDDLNDLDEGTESAVSGGDDLDLGLDLGDSAESAQAEVSEDITEEGEFDLNLLDGAATEDDLDVLSLDDLDDIDESTEPAISGDDDLDLSVDDLGELDEEEIFDAPSEFVIDDPMEAAQLDDLTLPEAESAETVASEELEDTILDFSDVAEIKDTEDQTGEAFEGLGLNLDEGEEVTDLNDLDTSLSLDNLEEVETTSLSADETEEITDEVNTKLDLARAYVDMGDGEGARSILEEVLGEGNQGQQQEAQQLLDQLT